MICSLLLVVVLAGTNEALRRWRSLHAFDRIFDKGRAVMRFCRWVIGVNIVIVSLILVLCLVLIVIAARAHTLPWQYSIIWLEGFIAWAVASYARQHIDV